MTILPCTSEDGQQLIKASEGGPRLLPYKCGANVWTIGWGHTSGVTANTRCTSGEAEMLFQKDMDDVAQIMARLFTVPMSQGMIDALASFVFNYGETKTLGYKLRAMINDGGPDSAIDDQWLKYVYTIRDEDGDEDLDAMIDAGLPIRRYREIIIRHGYSWDVAQAAANLNNIELQEKRIPWRNGGFKEILVSPTPVHEVLERAAHYASFQNEVPETALVWWPEGRQEIASPAPADLPELHIPRRGAPEPEPFEIPPDAAPPPPPQPSDELNKRERKRIKEKPEPASKPPSVYTDPDTGSKPIEDSERVEGRTREREGERWLGFVRILFPAGAGPAVLGFFNSWAFWQVFAVISLALVAGAGYGAYRLLEGRSMKEKGRSRASQLLH